MLAAPALAVLEEPSLLAALTLVLLAQKHFSIYSVDCGLAQAFPSDAEVARILLPPALPPTLLALHPSSLLAAAPRSFAEEEAVNLAMGAAVVSAEEDALAEQEVGTALQAAAFPAARAA